MNFQNIFLNNFSNLNLCTFDKTGGKGTRKGRPNCKSSILLKVVRSILPASKLWWEEVADPLYEVYDYLS